jgi:hypothetical protein
MGSRGIFPVDKNKTFNSFRVQQGASFYWHKDQWIRIALKLDWIRGLHIDAPDNPIGALRNWSNGCQHARPQSASKKDYL